MADKNKRLHVRLNDGDAWLVECIEVDQQKGVNLSALVRTLLLEHYMHEYGGELSETEKQVNEVKEWLAGIDKDVHDLRRRVENLEIGTGVSHVQLLPDEQEASQAVADHEAARQDALAQKMKALSFDQLGSGAVRLRKHAEDEGDEQEEARLEGD